MKSNVEDYCQIFMITLFSGVKEEGKHASGALHPRGNEHTIACGGDWSKSLRTASF